MRKFPRGRFLRIFAFLALFAVLSDVAAANQASSWPNIPFPTLGGRQFWADRYLYAGWRIQENVVTGHARLLDPRNVRRCWGRWEACRAEFELIRTTREIAPYNGHLVLLVHGLGRSRASFGGLERALSKGGYDVATVAWPSTRRKLAANADALQELLENLEGVERISFVTHSLGGLLVREALSRDADWRGRIAVNAVVMIAPPSRGSAMADTLQYVPPVNLLLWRGLFDATTESVARLPAPDAPFGIIAAGRGGRGYNPLLEGDDDMIVRVEETRLDGAADWVHLPGMHTFVMNRPETVRAVTNFIEHKRFGEPQSR